jgi:hypothetical protein
MQFTPHTHKNGKIYIFLGLATKKTDDMAAPAVVAVYTDAAGELYFRDPAEFTEKFKVMK